MIFSVKSVYSPELFHCWCERKGLHEHVMFVSRVLSPCCGHEVISKPGMCPETRQDLLILGIRDS